MKKILLSTLVCFSFTSQAFAMVDYKNDAANDWSSYYVSSPRKVAKACDRPSIFSVGAYGGYGFVNGAYKQDGQVALARLNLGIKAVEEQNIIFGLEAGVQSGNNMRLNASDDFIAATGGLPIQSTLKPLVDFLITAKMQILNEIPLFVTLKGGVAFRQLVLNDRSSSQDAIKKFNGEVQAGLAYNFTNHLAIASFYQGIYSGNNAGLAINSVGDVTISRIPTQQAGFLGLEYSI